MLASLARSFLFVVMLGSISTPGSAAEISFRNDVMPVLSKAGCNLGTCHGNQNGKGGFRLSLRGDLPERDYQTLTRDLNARRVNVLNPEKSLLLLKPTMTVAHEGGKRFEMNSSSYQTLHDWIAAGLPRDRKSVPRLTQLKVTPQEKYLIEPVSSLQLSVQATFSDGSSRDVTSLAVFESSNPAVKISHDGLVERIMYGEFTISVRFLELQSPVHLVFLPANQEFTWNNPQPHNLIDEHIFAKLERLRMNPSELCDDRIFLRRAYFDLLGMPPSVDEVQKFLNSEEVNKRENLIDRLLTRPEYGERQALHWSDILRNEERTLDRTGVKVYYKWVKDWMSADRPLNEFVQALISAEGSTYKSPPANYYRALRDPLTRAETTAQLFLGIRLQCAKCHNHPFDVWTQQDYYSWANFFSRVDYKIISNKRRDKNDKHEFNGEQIVNRKATTDVKHPLTGKILAPNFLGETSLKLNPKEDRLKELANWMGDNNSRFAKAQANRIWSHFMGRGLVDPIDDFRATNPASHPELLEDLARKFQQFGYRQKPLIKLIMMSRAYQTSSEPNEINREDTTNYSHNIARRYSAEQLLDALAISLDAEVEFNGYEQGTRAGQISGVHAIRLREKSPSRGDAFLKAFGKPPRQQSCSCERSESATLNQTFHLISGPLMNSLLTQQGNRLGAMSKEKLPDEQAIRTLYLATLSREPTPVERKQMGEHLRQGTEANERRRALEDIAWALLNSKEFLLRY